MDTKLTLRMNRDIISRIKLLAQKEEKSLSGLTEDLYKRLLNEKSLAHKELSPFVNKYRGILKEKIVNEKEDKLSAIGRKHA